MTFETVKDLKLETDQQTWLGLAEPVSELIPNYEIEDQTARFAGSVLVEKVVEVEKSPSPSINSLMDAIKLAATGDEEALMIVRKNVATDMMERTIKAGFVLSSAMDIKEDGQLSQHGQSYRSIQANSLRYVTQNPVMKQRTWAETNNCFRLEQLTKDGLLNEYSFVVFSLAEKDMPEHFFVDTQTLTIQVSRKVGDKLYTESAFVAGKDRSGEEHDRVTVDKIIGLFKQSSSRGKDALDPITNAERLNHPWLIHNSLIPNGAVDLVKLYDDFNGGTFYGQDEPRQEYLEHKEECERREAKYEEYCSIIAGHLINEAKLLNTPYAASARLDQLSREYSLKLALTDEQIDPRVFGQKSAEYISMARSAVWLGKEEAANFALALAYAHETSVSCAGGINGRGEYSKREDEEDEYGSLVFDCPSCGFPNVRDRHKLLDKCMYCSESVKCG